MLSEAGGAAGSSVLSAGMHLLAAPEFLDAARPDRVIVLGRPTLYRQVGRLLADSRVSVDVVAQPQGYADPAGTARVVAPGRLDVSCASRRRVGAATGTGPNHVAAAAVRSVVDELDIAFSPRLARELVAALPEPATLVLGSSQGPRDVGLTVIRPGRSAGGGQSRGGRDRRHRVDRGRASR